jgi:hypothetical protein
LYPETVNLPGDGKFDQNSVPTNSQGVAKLELSFGRVDFAKMPIFTNAPLLRSEIDLLRQYLAKNHRYRYKLFSLPNHSIVHGYFGSALDNPIYNNSVRHASRWFGSDPSTLAQSDLFLDKRAQVWGFQSGSGEPDKINNCSGCTVHNSQELTTNEPPVGFYMLLGSWFGDWNLSVNNLMRATLATTNNGLACMWVRFTDWHLEPMAIGETLGEGQLRSVNYPNLPSDFTTRVLGIMGDPTLRLFPIAPPGAVTAANVGQNVTLTWNPSPESTAQYYVYRSTNGMDGQFLRLTASPISSTAYTDTNAPSGQKVYKVRCLRTVVSGCGSYTNLSQAIFRTTN